MLRPYATGGLLADPVQLLPLDRERDCGGWIVVPASGRRALIGGESGCEMLVYPDGTTRVDPDPNVEVDACDHGQHDGHSELPLPCSRCPRQQHEQMIAARIQRWLGPPRGPQPKRVPLATYEIVFEGDQVVERRVWW